MFFKLLFVFILIPFIELAILVKIGTMIGFWYTMSVVVVTAIVGASLARYQGLKVYSRIQGELNSGRIPSEDMLDAMFVFAGGIVLLTPGFITDIAGIMFLTPVTRKIFKSHLKNILGDRIRRYNKETTVSIED